MRTCLMCLVYAALHKVKLYNIQKSIVSTKISYMNALIYKHKNTLYTGLSYIEK